MEENHPLGSRSKVQHQHLKKFGTSKYSSQIDSPLYDASEEDNTDDGSSIRAQPWTRAGAAPSGSPAIQSGRQNYGKGISSSSRGGAVSATSRLAHVSVDADSGVDSPTYDGDVETNTAVPSSKHSTATLSPGSSKGTSLPSVVGHQDVVGSLNALPGPTITTPSSPVSSTYPDPPSSFMSITDDENSLVPGRGPRSVQPHRQHSNNSPAARPTMPMAPPSGNVSVTVSHKNTPKASEQPLPDTAPLDVATRGYKDDRMETDGLVNTSLLSAEEIRGFVQRAIDGEGARPYKINKPPTGRPVRIYADGVYDMFHFGHALQLRQAKLSFPSVHLLVGVPDDELCRTLKAPTVMSHFERLESVRHCRWTDEVVPDAPWVITPEFIRKYEIDYVAHDEAPYAGSSGSGDIYGPIKHLGKFLPTRRTPGVSTSSLLERLVSRYRMGEFDGKLEKMGHGELSARGSQYSDTRPTRTKVHGP